MESTKVTVTGLFRDDIEADDFASGTGWVIGDGVTLTAGHVVFEYNRSRISPSILDGGNSIILDFENYEDEYRSAVQARIDTGTLSSSVTNGVIEAGIISRDAVAIAQGGLVAIPGTQY